MNFDPDLGRLFEELRSYAIHIPAIRELLRVLNNAADASTLAVELRRNGDPKAAAVFYMLPVLVAAVDAEMARVDRLMEGANDR